MTEKTFTITGQTYLLGILADPVHHVKTPEEMNAFLQRNDINMVMLPFHVLPENLEAAVAGLQKIENLKGFIVTVPHKSSVVKLCNQLSETAQRAGAVNIVRCTESGLYGDLTDGIGFVAALHKAGIKLQGLSVYLAGAGGAGKAIAFALAAQGIAELHIANRTADKAKALIEQLSDYFPGVIFKLATADPSGCQLVINATSMGLHKDDALPLDASKLVAEQTVAEIIMQPEYTPLLKAAKALGCRTQLGRPMLQCQIEQMAKAMGIAFNSESQK